MYRIPVSFPGFLCVLGSLAAADYEATQQAEAILEQIDGQSEVTLVAYGDVEANIYQKYTAAQGGGLDLYAPLGSAIRSRILTAYSQGVGPLLALFNATGNPPHVIAVVADQVESSEGEEANAITKEFIQPSLLNQNQNYIYMAIEDSASHPEHTFLHELMHLLQRTTDHHPGDAMEHSWYVEGPPQMAPYFAGAPASWINRDLLFGNRFLEAIRNAHGKTLFPRDRNASLFWFYYWRKIHGGANGPITTAFTSYKQNGFSNAGQSWFNFPGIWHDFAIALVNRPGAKTGVLGTLDSQFDALGVSAVDPAAGAFSIPYADKLVLPPLSHFYVSPESLGARTRIFFAWPDQQFPPGVEVSVALLLPGGDSWQTFKLDANRLGGNWVRSFPRDGQAELDTDESIAYDDIAFILTNSSDSNPREVHPVITGDLAPKYSGRGVETDTGTKYVMTGRDPNGKLATGWGFVMHVREDGLITAETSRLWFQKFPREVEPVGGMEQRAVNYINRNAKFQGDVDFDLVALRPESFEIEGGRPIEKGKLTVRTRERRDWFDNPNHFRIGRNSEEMARLALGGVLGPATLDKKFNEIEKTEAPANTYGWVRKQLFLKTITLTAGLGGGEVELDYIRGKDDNPAGPNYLKLRVGQGEWFILREKP